MRSLETSDTWVIEFDFADSEGSEGMKVVYIDNDVCLFPKELVENLAKLHHPAHGVMYQ